MAPNTPLETEGYSPTTSLADNDAKPLLSTCQDEKSSMAPGAPRRKKPWVAGWMARLHDDMNLVILGLMSLIAAWSMWTNNVKAQYVLTIFATVYMMLDALWILCNPHGVKSPRTVLGHHVATLSVLIDPLMQPNHALYTACALLVEFNTFLLILRRRVDWGAFVEVPFAVSWVVLRLIWYPFLGFYMTLATFPGQAAWFPAWLVDLRNKLEPVPTPMFLFSFLAWVGICLFQGWWSCALYQSYSRPPRATRRKDESEVASAKKFL